MKKILLIIIIILCIWKLIALAAVITVGNEAIDQTNHWDSTYTIIDANNPADGTGTITSIEIWTKEELSNCEVAIFFVVSGENFSTRDNVTLGTVAAGSKQTFYVDSGSNAISLDVQVGDLIGMYATAGTMERDGGGGSLFYRTPKADNIPCTDITFTAYNGELSLKGIGATEEEAAINVINMGTNF